MFPAPDAPCAQQDLDNDRVSAALAEILRRVEELYRTAGAEPPSRRFWGLGTQVQDCSELVVSLVSLDPDESEGNCDRPMRATVAVMVSRCTPVSGNKRGTAPPSKSQIESAAEMLAKDAWILARGACALDLYNMGRIDGSMDFEQGQGGLQAARLTITVVI
jgi:hypothetical protein